MQPKDKRRLNLRKGMHKKTRSLMNDIFEITDDFNARSIAYNFPMIARELRKNPDSRSDYNEIANVFNNAREIAKEVLRSMSRVFIDDHGNPMHEFIDYEGKVLTIPQAEKHFVDLLMIHKIPYEYYDFVAGTLIPMTSFAVRESINQERLIKVAFSIETVLEDMVLTNDKIQITNKTAVESLSYIKDAHKKYLTDGLTQNKSKKNIWEKEITPEQEAKELDTLMHKIEKRKMELAKQILTDKEEDKNS